MKFPFDLRRSVELHAAIESGRAAVNVRGDIIHLVRDERPTWDDKNRTMVLCRTKTPVWAQKVYTRKALESSLVRVCALCLGRRGRKILRDQADGLTLSTSAAP